MKISYVYSKKVRTLNNINWEFFWNSNSRWLLVCQIPATLWVNINSMLALLTHTQWNVYASSCNAYSVGACSTGDLTSQLLANVTHHILLFFLKVEAFLCDVLTFVLRLQGCSFYYLEGTHTSKRKGKKQNKSKQAWCDTGDERLLWQTLWLSARVEHL